MSSCYDKIQRIPSLTPEQLHGLSQMVHQIRFYRKKFMRMGMHKMGRPSCYETSSLFKMPNELHEEIKQFIPKDWLDQSVVRYFLRFPTIFGRLDGQDCWMDKPRPMAIAAWSLTGKNSIFVSEPIPEDTPFEKMYADGNIVKSKRGTYTCNEFRRRFIARTEPVAVQTAPVRHAFDRGEGFLMGLSLFHEIHESDRIRDWFCLGIPPGFAHDFSSK